MTDITNRADMCRGTFYLHYEKVGDVIGEFQDDYINSLDAKPHLPPRPHIRERKF